MRTTMTTAVVAAAGLAVGGLTLPPAQAAPGDITISGPTYPGPGADTAGSPFVSMDCGLTVAFADATPSARYDASIALASAPDVAVEVDQSVVWDEQGTGEASFDCGYRDEDHLLDGETYVVTVVELSARGAVVGEGTATVAYDEVDAPADIWLSSGGERLIDDLPTARPIDLTVEGAWEEGATVTTRVSRLPREVVDNDWEVDEDPFVDVLAQTTTGTPALRFSLPHHLGGDYVFVSVRADKPGKAPVVVTFEEPFEVVTSPP
ncbi:hypothetical protein, partial [Nocardioides zeae]